MKTIKNIFIVTIVSLTIFSCNREKIETDNFLNNNVLFFIDSNANLLVEDGAANTLDIAVGSTGVSNNNLSYSISVDDSSTAVQGVDFDIVSTSTSFSSGQNTTSFSIVGDFDNAETEGKTVVFNLTSTEAGVSDANQFTLQLIKLCPIDADFTGDYALTYVANGLFDTPSLTPGVVTLSVGATPTERQLSAAPYPAFGVFPPITFTFSLICSNVVVASGQATNVGCGGVGTFLGPNAIVGSYNPSDDSMITVVYTDDVDGASCAADGNLTAEFILTKL